MKEKELYLAPVAAVLELKNEGVICTSGPGEIPGDLGEGGWI